MLIPQYAQETEIEVKLKLNQGKQEGKLFKGKILQILQGVRIIPDKIIAVNHEVCRHFTENCGQLL